MNKHAITNLRKSLNDPNIRRQNMAWNKIPATKVAVVDICLQMSNRRYGILFPIHKIPAEK